ncbi:MAG: flagellar hook basal-body protein [Deltaproteobacteria bacterium]|nr:flagellar hook basal-body protein [Deltaproteobacteria bacterium]
MPRLHYIAMSGATARLRELDELADDLANQATPGYRAVTYAFSTAIDEEILGNKQAEKDAPMRQVLPVETSVVRQDGPAVRTGRPLDVRPTEGTWLSVQQADGTVTYTRDGRMQVGVDGFLRVGHNKVLGVNAEPIAVDPGTVPFIDERGRVFAGERESGRLGLFQLPGELQRVGPAQVLPRKGQAVTVDGTVTVGAIDGSNANGLDSTISMISAQRSYEQSLQALQTVQKLDDKANEIGRPRG